MSEKEESKRHSTGLERGEGNLGPGKVRINMNGGYRTCGGSCSRYATDPATGEIYCVASCSGGVAPECSCHLYSYPTPAPGVAPPDMGDWTHEWKPGDPKIKPAAGTTYVCVCVRPR